MGEVLGNFDKLLHVHHEGEDLLMYPKLAARAPACALHIKEMLGQHAAVAERLDAIAPVRERWTQTADPASGEDLAAKYESLSALLKVHLRREVTEVTPAVEKVVTEKELEEMASHGVDAFDKKVVLAYLGMILATNPLRGAAGVPQGHSAPDQAGVPAGRQGSLPQAVHHPVPGARDPSDAVGARLLRPPHASSVLAAVVSELVMDQGCPQYSAGPTANRLLACKVMIWPRGASCPTDGSRCTASDGPFDLEPPS